MAAPALVALAHGSRDPRSAATINALVDEVRSMRPDLRIEAAFLELSKPSFETVVDQAGPGRLRRDRGRPAAAHRGLPRQGRRPRGHRRGRGPPRGPHASGPPRSSAWRPRSSRCSTCGCARRSRTPGSASSTPSCWPPPAPRDPLANQAVARLARTWGTRHKLPVTAAFASAAPPAAGEAVRAFRAEGRRHIAVASFFLAPGFLPDRAAELALEAGAVAVSDPLGAAPRGRPRGAGALRRRRRRARPRLKAAGAPRAVTAARGGRRGTRREVRAASGRRGPRQGRRPWRRCRSVAHQRSPAGSSVRRASRAARPAHRRPPRPTQPVVTLVQRGSRSVPATAGTVARRPPHHPAGVPSRPLALSVADADSPARPLAADAADRTPTQRDQAPGGAPAGGRVRGHAAVHRARAGGPCSWGP